MSFWSFILFASLSSFVLLGHTHGLRFESTRVESDVKNCSIDQTKQEIIFKNLRKLIYSGDYEYSIPSLAPFVVDEVRPSSAEKSKLGHILEMRIDGYDNFVVINSSMNRACTDFRFELFLPRVMIRSKQADVLLNLFTMETIETNTTIVGEIELEPNENACFFLRNIRVSWNYEAVDAKITSANGTPPAEDEVANRLLKPLIQALKPFDLENKAKTIKIAAKRIFNRIGCWAFSPDRLLASNDQI